ncbi:MAG: peptidoglycan-associated lipoprotein Pal [Pseudoxanthomonas suwonensis]|nr:peptidoglycan-associated lipoprotein Pal [Pseudoxanthomonas suwonensis]
MNTVNRLMFAAAICVLAVGCSRKVREVPPTETTPPPATTAPTTPPGATTPGAYGPGDLDTDACLRQRVVYFDFDQDTLRPEFQNIVACHAKYLRDRPSSRMTLEGHADERGSREYNMGLGERRGNGVSSAIQANGGSGTQMSVVSYGEERPTCTDAGEGCWSRNRRVEIVYSAR